MKELKERLEQAQAEIALGNLKRAKDCVDQALKILADSNPAEVAKATVAKAKK
jgi:lipopolysaccharide biosynthesis regulator YciM